MEKKYILRVRKSMTRLTVIVARKFKKRKFGTKFSISNRATEGEPGYENMRARKSILLAKFDFSAISLVHPCLFLLRVQVGETACRDAH